MSIFQNLKIVDLTRIFSGPLATKQFSMQGAEVIKVESLDGDDTKNFPPLVGNWSGYYENLNHNKKSIALDLKTAEGLAKLYELCKTADVFVQNFSPGVKAKLKIEYQSIKAINPNIIYASLSGISSTDESKYYDLIAQAESGLISLNGFVNRTAIVDAYSGMKLAFAISSGLYYREKNSDGLEVDVSMKGCSFDLLEQNLIEISVTKTNPDPTFDTAICPFGVFQTKTKDVALAIGNDKLWAKFLVALENINNQFDFHRYNYNQKRLDAKVLIYQNIQNLFQQYEANYLKELFDRYQIPFGIVQTMTDVLADQTNYDNGFLQKLKLPNGLQVVVSNMGIEFQNHPQSIYIPAPKLNSNDF